MNKDDGVISDVIRSDGSGEYRDDGVISDNNHSNKCDRSSRAG